MHTPHTCPARPPAHLFFCQALCLPDSLPPCPPLTLPPSHPTPPLPKSHVLCVAHRYRRRHRHCHSTTTVCIASQQQPQHIQFTSFSECVRVCGLRALLLLACMCLLYMSRVCVYKSGVAVDPKTLCQVDASKCKEIAYMIQWCIVLNGISKFRLGKKDTNRKEWRYRKCVHKSEPHRQSEPCISTQLVLN